VLALDPGKGRSGRVCAPMTKLGRLLASRVVCFLSHCNAPHLVYRVEDRFRSPQDFLIADSRLRANDGFNSHLSEAHQVLQ